MTSSSGPVRSLVRARGSSAAGFRRGKPRRSRTREAPAPCSSRRPSTSRWRRDTARRGRGRSRPRRARRTVSRRGPTRTTCPTKTCRAARRRMPCRPCRAGRRRRRGTPLSARSLGPAGVSIPAAMSAASTPLRLPSTNVASTVSLPTRLTRRDITAPRLTAWWRASTMRERTRRAAPCALDRWRAVVKGGTVAAARMAKSANPKTQSSREYPPADNRPTDWPGRPWARPP